MIPNQGKNIMTLKTEVKKKETDLFFSQTYIILDSSGWKSMLKLLTSVANSVLMVRKSPRGCKLT